MSLDCAVQVSVKVGQKHRSAQTMSKKASTRIAKTTNHVDLSERSEVTSMGYLDLKHSSTGDATADQTGALSCSVLHNVID